MNSYSSEYILLFIFLFFSLLLCILLYSISFFTITKDVYYEKNLGYECGFNPFEDARNTFNVHFYLVGLVFIIFDLEIILLFPWIISFTNNFIVCWSILFFIIILVVGFIYEWRKKALEWS